MIYEVNALLIGYFCIYFNLKKLFVKHLAFIYQFSINYLFMNLRLMWEDKVNNQSKVNNKTD